MGSTDSRLHATVREWLTFVVLVALVVTYGVLWWHDQTASAIATLLVLVAVALRPRDDEDAVVWTLRAVTVALVLGSVTARHLGHDLLADVLLAVMVGSILLRGERVAGWLRRRTRPAAPDSFPG